MARLLKENYYSFLRVTEGNLCVTLGCIKKKRGYFTLVRLLKENDYSFLRVTEGNIYVMLGCIEKN